MGDLSIRYSFFERNMVGVNLIPKDLQLTEALRRHLKVWTVAIVGAAALMSAPLAMGWYRRAEASELRVQNDQLQTLLSEDRANLRVMAARASQAASRLERATALRSKRPWSRLLVMIGDYMPEGCWLTSIGTDPATPPAVAARRSRKPRVAGGEPGRPESSDRRNTLVIEAPRKLRITGYATDAAEPLEFVSALKASGVFSNITLENMRREPVLDGFYFRFELLCGW